MFSCSINYQQLFIYFSVLFLFSCDEGSGNARLDLRIDFDEQDAIKGQYKYLLVSKNMQEDSDFNLSGLKSKLYENHFEFDGNLISLKDIQENISVREDDEYLILYSLSFQSILDVIEIGKNLDGIVLKKLHTVTDSVKANSYNVLDGSSNWILSNQTVSNASIIIPSTVTGLNFTNFTGKNLIIAASSSANFINYSWSNVFLTGSLVSNVQSTINLHGNNSFEECFFKNSGQESFLFNASSTELIVKNSIIENVEFVFSGSAAEYEIGNVYIKDVGILFELNTDTEANIDSIYALNVKKFIEAESSIFSMNNLVVKEVERFGVMFKSEGVIENSHIESLNTQILLEVELRSTLSFSDSIVFRSTNLMSYFGGYDIVIQSPIETDIILENCYIDFGSSSIANNVFDRFDTNILEMGEVRVFSPEDNLIPVSF